MSSKRLGAGALKPCPFCGGEARLQCWDGKHVMLACSECECELFDSHDRGCGESFDDFIVRRIEKWNTRPEPGRGQTRAGKKSGREKGDVWNLKVFVEDGRELTRARDKFQAVIHILRDRPFSVADSNLIMFMRMVRDSVRIAPPP